MKPYYTCYLIGPIQDVVKPGMDHDENSWRKIFSRKAKSRGLPIKFIEPVVMEKTKTGLDVYKTHQLVNEAILAADEEALHSYGSHIFSSNPSGDFWAVRQSDFIVGLGRNAKISVGTSGELALAADLQIPVIWVSPGGLSKIINFSEAFFVYKNKNFSKIVSTFTEALDYITKIIF